MYILKTSRNRTREVFDILKTVVSMTRYKPGCLFIELWQQKSDSGTILLQEEWSSLDQLKLHMHSDVFKRTLYAMEMCNIKPDVRIVDCDQEKGIGWITEVLLGKSLIEIPEPS